jgi:ATP-dependent Clp protease ATP-binding subunit ClpA
MPPKKSQGAGSALALEALASRILLVRGIRVMIDADLASLYGVPTKALNQAIKRNAERFPPDFMFQLSAAEKAEVVTNCDHLQNLKFSKARPYVFTEHGAIQAANVLNSPRAAEMGIYVVRAFVQLRDLLASNKELAQRFVDLERRLQRKLATHDQAIAGILDAIRQLMNPPQPPKRPIGFVTLTEKKKPGG